MQLVELTEAEKIQYNNFVAANPGGSFLQAWEWGGWQEVLGRQVFRYKVLDDSNECISVFQLIRMPLPLGKYYLYCPYGPVVEGKSEILISKFEKIYNILKIKFSEAVFYRFEFKNFSNFDFRASNLNFVKTKNIQPGKTLVVDLTKTEEQILAEMHHKTRYNIKLAKKHSVEIKEEFEISTGHGLFYEEATNLIVETARRQGYKGYGVGYYKKMIDYLMVQNRGDLKLHIYKAIFQNKLLSAAVMLDYGKTRTFLFGGSSEFDKNVMAPYLLHFQAIIDAKAVGLSTYDFWGIETSAGDTPGFVRFKMGFSESPDAIKQYPGAYDLVINSWQYKLYNILRFINKFLKRGR